MKRKVLFNLVLLLAVGLIGGQTKNANYSCHEFFCTTAKYSTLEALNESFSVFVNIVFAIGNKTYAKDDLKNINVHKMVLHYAPTLIISWQDPRLKAYNQNNTKLRQVDTGKLSRLVWTPEITISNQIDVAPTNVPKWKLNKQKRTRKFYTSIVHKCNGERCTNSDSTLECFWRLFGTLGRTKSNCFIT